MIDDYLDQLILNCIPQKKYTHEWNENLLKEKTQEVFGLDLPIKIWFDEEGVDEEEIKKRIHDQVSKKYEHKKNIYSPELISYAEKRVMLYQIDKDWREHLAPMDVLRGSVNLRAMGGKDPFYEYKKESFDYFGEMLSEQNEKVLKTLFNLELVSSQNTNKTEKKDTSKVILAKKIGRNTPCPCGSGKKYKFCHGL
jgi:Preprotein translocase subunit SecA (ATPase, RNA helicase)